MIHMGGMVGQREKYTFYMVVSEKGSVMVSEKWTFYVVSEKTTSLWFPSTLFPATVQVNFPAAVLYLWLCSFINS